MLSLDLTPDDIEYLAHRKAHEALMIQPDKPMSYLAVDKRTETIVAIQISYLVHPSDRLGNPKFESMAPEGPKMQKLIDFWHLMLSGIHEFFPPAYSNPYLMNELTIVDPAYRRYGLMMKMGRMMSDRAMDEFGCKYIISLLTSYKTIHSAGKRYEILRWIRYEDYYVDGKRVFDFGADSKEKYAKLIMGDFEQLRKDREKAKL